jgi:antitoxin HicB
MKYSITIQCSDEDNCFVVFLREFEDVLQPVTHSETYEEALKNAQEVLELLIESALNNNEDLPKPNIFGQLLQLA